MRKFVLLITLFALGTGRCFSQGYSVEPLSSYVHGHYYNTVNYYGVGLDLDFEYQLSERMYLTTEVGVCFEPSSRNVYGTELSIGLKYMLNEYLFVSFDMQPKVRFHGDAQNLYRSYLMAYFRDGVGVGANIDFNSYHHVYIEAKLCGDNVIYDESKNYNGGVYLMIGIGYRYKFF